MVADQDLSAKVRRVKAVFSDVDGVLTDGSVYVGPDDFELKRFSIQDGVGAALARLARIPLVLISGRYSEATASRARQLRIEDVHQGNLNKLEPFEKMLTKYDLTPEEVLFIGDGWIDVPVMEKVGVPVTVPGAPQSVLDVAIHVTRTRGGEGVLREVLEWLLEHQGRMEEVIAAMHRKIYKADH